MSYQDVVARLFARVTHVARHLSAHAALAASLATFASSRADAQQTAPTEPSVSNLRLKRFTAKHILRRTNGAILRLAGHRSHASHSSHSSHASHASHYSGSTGYTPPPSPPPAPAPAPANIEPSPVSRSPVPTRGWRDSFDEPFAATSRWHVVTPIDESDRLVAVLRVNSRLEISPRAHQTGHHFNGYTTDPLDLLNGSAQVELVEPAHGADTIFAVAADASNWYGFRIRGTQLYCESHVYGVKHTLTLTYSPHSDRFLRVIHERGVGLIAWETSPDGIRWTARYSEAAGIPLSSMRAVLSAGTHAATASPGTAVFDNFEYTNHD